MTISEAAGPGGAVDASAVRRNQVHAGLWLLGGCGALAVWATNFRSLALDWPGLAVSGFTLAVSVALFASVRRLPRRLVLPLTLLSQVLVTAGGMTVPVEAVNGTMGYAYLWGTAFAAYYLPWSRSVLQAAFTLALYGTWLWFNVPASVGAARWLATATALVAFTAIIGRLRDELHRLVGALTREARHDPLTGLLNRRGLSERAADEAARRRRPPRPLAVLAVDVDPFKQLNDEWGHAAGDAALVGLGALLREQCRGQDHVARRGGEEFAVLLPDTDVPAAVQVAERIRVAVHGLQAVRPLTISIGVSGCDADHDPALGRGCAAGLEELLAEADEALYAAKAAGRDRVRTHSRAASDPGPGSPAAASASAPAVTPARRG